MQNNIARVRDMVAVPIIEATAKQRFARGDPWNLIAAFERPGHKEASSVDICYDPPTKDTPGWRGPAQIAIANYGGGAVTVQFHGKILDRRHQ